MPPLDLMDAEHLKRVVVDPVIAALRAEMREAVRAVIDELNRLRQSSIERDHRVESIERRLSGVESFKSRIVAVCGGVAVVAGVVWRVLSDWIGNYFFSGH